MEYPPTHTHCSSNTAECACCSRGRATPYLASAIAMTPIPPRCVQVLSALRFALFTFYKGGGFVLIGPSASEIRVISILLCGKLFQPPSPLVQRLPPFPWRTRLRLGRCNFFPSHMLDRSSSTDEKNMDSLYACVRGGRPVSHSKNMGITWGTGAYCLLIGPRLLFYRSMMSSTEYIPARSLS